MTVREAITASLRLLSDRDRRLLGLAVIVQMATSLLDLVGVLLLGTVGVLAVSAVGGTSAPERLRAVVSSFGLGDLSNAALIAVLAVSAAALLLIKTAVGPLLMARLLKFLARREALVAARLTRELLSRPLTFLQRRSSQETASALIGGANSATVVVLGQMVSAVSEMALLALLALTLLVVNPAVAVGVIAFFALVSAGLQQALGQRATLFAIRRRRADVASLVSVQEAIGTYREITVGDRRSLYVDRLEHLRTEAADASAGTQLANTLPKYVSEAALVVGGFALAGVLFTTRPAAVAAGTFALFLATATRVMPSLLRLQNAALSIRAGAATARPTFELAEDLGYPLDCPGPREPRHAIQRSLPDGQPGFTPTIDLTDVSFAYPDSDTSAITGINIAVKPGQSVALIGRSGAGKSTLADVILGVLTPDSGQVEVGGMPPADAVRQWPGALAYVPQDVMLTNDSVRANVALGLPRELIDDVMVWDALRRAHLADFLADRPDALDTEIGERGIRLSGGQRQRLGIARALFTRPRLLVLDEATSSLDAETELSIMTILKDLDYEVTMVIIAHRLSTVRDADLVIYLEDGRVLATGSFEEVRSRVPALHRQADLMGIRPA